MKLENTKYFYFGGMLFYLIACFFAFHSSAVGLNPDLISYLSIAKKYSEGHIVEAINGYWSPLFSWTLMPFFWFKIDPLVSVRLVNILTGLVILWYAIRMVERLFVLPWVRLTCYATLCAFSFTYQFCSQTPDLISAFFFLVFLNQFCSDDFFLKKNFVRNTGIVAGLCYFAKSYMFVFCLVFFIAVILFFLILHKDMPTRKVLLKRFANVLLVFGLVVIPWLFALKMKYNEYTISTAPRYNNSVFTPHGDTLHYTTYAGLIAPPDQYGTFGWEDPSYFKVVERKVLESVASIRYQLGIVSYNTRILIYMFRYYSYFGLGLIPILLSIAFFYRKKEGKIALIIIGSALLYIVGYYLIFIKERYLLPAHLVLIIATFYVIEFYCVKYVKWRYLQWGIFVLVACSFIKNPVSVFYYSKSVFKEEIHSIALAYELAEKRIVMKKRFATPTSTSGIYNFMPLTAFLSEGKFYGELALAADEKEQQADLKKYSIHYFFFMGCSKLDNNADCIDHTLPSYLIGRPIVFENKRMGLTVYDIQ